MACLRTPGTGTWFISGNAFKSWSDLTPTSSQRLWLNGFTGARKKYYYDSCHWRASFAAAWTYQYSMFLLFLQRWRISTSAKFPRLDASTNMWSLWSYYEELESRYDTTPKAMLGKPSRLHVNTLIELLIKQSNNRQHLCILIDGVSERNEPSEISQALKTISTLKHVRILVSSVNEKGGYWSKHVRIFRLADWNITPRRHRQRHCALGPLESRVSS